MLSMNNLEKLIELEAKLRAEYQVQLDAKSADIEAGIKKQEEQQAVIARQLEQIRTLSAEAEVNKRAEQQIRELESRSAKLLEEVTTQKKSIKSLQNDLAEERTELKSLKQFDPARMKKNLDANKRKLAEKTNANELLQKSRNKYRTENAGLQRQVEVLETKQAQLETPEDTDSVAA